MSDDKKKKSQAYSAARLAAVQAVYSLSMTDVSVDVMLREFVAGRIGQETLADDKSETVLPLADMNTGLFTDLVRATVEVTDQVDQVIDANLDGVDWQPDRLEATLRAILRVAMAEMLSRKRTPAKVVINEYVDVARAFYTGAEPRLVNAILDRYARVVREGEMS